jgi:N-methylhydantoinase B
LAASQFDPIKFEVIRNALVESTEEMTIALRRSAYSTNIKTRADFSCALFDSDLNVVAQASGQPVHLGSLAISVPTVIRSYGAEKLDPGDGILANDPYLGGVHLNDITLTTPVHHNGELFGYLACLAHHVDVGGGAPASIGAFKEVFQEGIIIPGVKLVRRGEIDNDVFKLVLAQIRSKRETAGDFRAQVAANNTGLRRVQLLLDRAGPETVRFYMKELLDYTRRRTQSSIANLPQGAFSADGYVDNDGFTDRPVHLKAKVSIDNDVVEFDTTGSDPQRPAPVNSTYAQT